MYQFRSVRGSIRFVTMTDVIFFDINKWFIDIYKQGFNVKMDAHAQLPFVSCQLAIALSSSLCCFP